MFSGFTLSFVENMQFLSAILSICVVIMEFPSKLTILVIAKQVEVPDLKPFSVNSFLDKLNIDKTPLCLSLPHLQYGDMAQVMKKKTLL